MLYRALTDLGLKDKIITKGTLFPASVLAPGNLEILERKGKIAIASAPPLEVLPGWKKRTDKLKAMNILMADELLEANSDDVAKIFKVTPETVEHWKRELAAQLENPKPTG